MPSATPARTVADLCRKATFKAPRSSPGRRPPTSQTGKELNCYQWKEFRIMFCGFPQKFCDLGRGENAGGRSSRSAFGIRSAGFTTT